MALTSYDWTFRITVNSISHKKSLWVTLTDQYTKVKIYKGMTDVIKTHTFTSSIKDEFQLLESFLIKPTLLGDSEDIAYQRANSLFNLIVNCEKPSLQQPKDKDNVEELRKQLDDMELKLFQMNEKDELIKKLHKHIQYLSTPSKKGNQEVMDRLRLGIASKLTEIDKLTTLESQLTFTHDTLTKDIACLQVEQATLTKSVIQLRLQPHRLTEEQELSLACKRAKEMARQQQEAKKRFHALYGEPQSIGSLMVGSIQ